MPNFFDKYPYTDFHELNLDWVIKIVKDLVADWAATLTEWHNTQEEWQQLYDYVHDYFDNLDVQSEINTKIDALIADGTFSTIVQPIIADQITSLDIPGQITTWLNDNVTPVGSAVVVDNSLSIAGAAADAKATGDWLRSGVGTIQQLANNADFNTITTGTYNFYTGGSWAGTNTPSDLAANARHLLIVRGLPTYAFQSIIAQNGCRYERNTGNGGSTWTAWRKIIDNKWTITGTGNDLDDLTEGIYNVYTSAGRLVNYPPTLPASSICIIECIGNSPFLFQFIYTQQGYIYQRYQNNGTWTSWIDITPGPIYAQRSDAMGIFHTFGVVGDSMSSGYGKLPDNTGYDFIDYSWPQAAARRLGNTVYNFTKSGLTTRSWLTDAKGYAVLSDGSHDAQGYAIMLGVNDVSSLGIAYLGDPSDINISDPSLNQDTFYGNYGKIISLIKQQVVDAKIFVFTIPATNAVSVQFNAAIEYMQTIFTNVYTVYMDPAMFGTKTFIGSNAVDSHYSPAGYIAIANYVMQLISDTIMTSPAEFFYVEQITI